MLISDRMVRTRTSLKEYTCKQNFEALGIAELGVMGKIGNIVKRCVIMFYLKHSVFDHDIGS